MKLSDARILLSVRCEECESGIVYDPTNFGWAELVKLELKEYRAALAERGYGLGDRLPPEEGPCSECEGSGRVTRQITLESLATLLVGSGPIARSLRAAFDAIGP